MIWGYHYFRKHPYIHIYISLAYSELCFHVRIQQIADLYGGVWENILLGGGSNFFYFHPNLGKISTLTNIFERGWNHQLDYVPKLGCVSRQLFLSDWKFRPWDKCDEEFGEVRFRPWNLRITIWVEWEQWSLYWPSTWDRSVLHANMLNQRNTGYIWNKQYHFVKINEGHMVS